MSWPNSLTSFDTMADVDPDVADSGTDWDAAQATAVHTAITNLETGLGLNTGDALLGGYDDLATYLSTVLADVNTDFAVEHNADGTHAAITATSIIVTSVVDLNGVADALVIDADADTTISAPTDDQIDIEISGADDFRLTANTFTALSGSSIVQTDGKMFLGDTADADITLGLCINQGAADDAILTLKSSDVGHGCTTYAETDTFAQFRKFSAAEGALNIRGLGESYQGVVLTGIYTTDSSLKATGAQPAVQVRVYKIDGTGITDVGANANLFGVQGYVGASMVTRWLVDEDGDTWQSGGFTNEGACYIGDTVNAKVTLGLTINQGAADDGILSLKSSDVAHAVTTSYEADDYAWMGKAEALAGGLLVVGLKDGDGVAGHAVRIMGVLDETAADTTKSAAGIGVLTLDATLEGTNVPAVCGADENLVVIRSLTTTRFIFDAEGEMHSDAVIGEGSDWDDWDDLTLVADLSRLPKAKFNEMMRYHAEDFERAGLVTLSVDEQGQRHAFKKHGALLDFYACCFSEVARRLERYERALLSLGVEPRLLEA